MRVMQYSTDVWLREFMKLKLIYCVAKKTCSLPKIQLFCSDGVLHSVDAVHKSLRRQRRNKAQYTLSDFIKIVFLYKNTVQSLLLLIKS